MKVGVVVGRFQVSVLTYGHMKLLQRAHDENDRLLVFLGSSRSPPSSREPMDFRTRELLIQQAFPSATVIHLPDQIDDIRWSKLIDSTAHTLFSDLKEGTIYAGRDGCLPHYLGSFKKVKIPEESGSGTEDRLIDSRTCGDSVAFRHGCIYAISRQAPRVIFATDIALVRDDPNSSGFQLLVGKKAGEDEYRFPGGKFDITDASLEACARRELEEETGIFAEHMEYICSYKVPDWRFEKNPDVKIATAFFLAREMTPGTAKAGDDLDSVEWVLLNKNTVVELGKKFMRSHQYLFQQLVNKLF